VPGTQSGVSDLAQLDLEIDLLALRIRELKELRDELLAGEPPLYVEEDEGLV
jgi:hypothetical protein